MKTSVRLPVRAWSFAVWLGAFSLLSQMSGAVHAETAVAPDASASGPVLKVPKAYSVAGGDRLAAACKGSKMTCATDGECCSKSCVIEQSIKGDKAKFCK